VQHNVKDLRDQLTGPHTGVFDAWSSTLILDESHMARIGRQLKSAADDAEDTLLVYYSGHGCLDSRRNELYLALRETHPDSLGFSAIHIDVLREAIQSSNAANKILVLDCCFSGVYQGSQPPAPRGTSIKDRQRAAARARLEKEMAERAAADRRRRQWQALMGSALFVILAVLLVWWLAAR
jgi:uncharacterized caspase-like protein